MKKVIAITLCLLILFLLSGCSPEVDDGQMITISEQGSFSKAVCENRGFKDKVIMLQSKYCRACHDAMPVFEEAYKELGVEPTILDLSEDGQREQMLSYGIQIMYTPTFIFGCNYYVGGDLTKGDYVKRMKKVNG